MKVVFKSGDEETTHLCCYDCGTDFTESLKGDEKVGDFVVCSNCGGRGAYITEFLDE